MNRKSSQLTLVAVITVIIATLFGTIAVMGAGFDLANGKILAICVLLIICGILGTISMVVTRKPEYRLLGMAGMIVSGISFLLMTLVILGEIGNQTLLQLTFSFFILAIALAHISLLHYFTLQNRYALYARITATVAIAIFSLLLITRVFEPFVGLYAMAYNQTTLKLIAASLIIDWGATLLVPLCNRIQVNNTVEFTFTENQSPAGSEEDEGHA